MNQIIKIRQLAVNVREYEFSNPDIAKHANPGQFIILRVDEEGERVPFTICDMDKNKGSITILVQSIGYTTYKMENLNEGDSFHDVVGPLGNATDLSKFNKVLLVGGGIGTAVIYPQAKYLKSVNKYCDVVVGAKTKSLIMYEDEFKKCVNNLYIVTDDGSYGDKGFVTTKVEQLIKEGNQYDAIMAVGPMMMMRAVCNLTRQYGIHTIVSMNCTMLDGTGMCGGCRLSVDKKIKYACVDGPEFDGHLVDFDEAMARSGYYKAEEQEHLCRLRGNK